MVDSSVWIDFFNGKDSPQTVALRSFLGEEDLLVGDLVLCEVLQGTRDDNAAQELEAALREFEVTPMLDPRIAIAAAANYRRLRAQGITVRKTIDLIIGTFCILRQHTLLHADRDFEPMEKYLGLQTVPTSWAVHDRPK